jgi:hypothetical protein
MTQITPEQALESIREDIERVIEIIDGLLDGSIDERAAEKLQPEVARIQARAYLAAIACRGPRTSKP